MIFSKNENTVLLVYFSLFSGKRRNNDQNSFPLFENCSSSCYGFWEAIHLRKQLAFSKNHFIVYGIPHLHKENYYVSGIHSTMIQLDFFSILLEM